MMKVRTAVIFFLINFVGTLVAFPADTTQGKDVVEIVPLEQHQPPQIYGDQPIVDTGVFSGPFSNPFDGLFQSIEGIMTRMREQMQQILKHLPATRSNSTNVSGFPGLHFPNIDDFDLGKGNTSSVTKVIDGHKVVINETEYKNEGDFGGSFFKVRIIDVKPDSAEMTTEADAEEITSTTTTATTKIMKDREAVENSFENEIPKNKEALNFDNIETFDEVIDTTPQKFTNNRWETIEPLNSIEDNSIIGHHSSHPVIDLSHDIYVNDILANSGAPINPDAEVFEIHSPPQPSRMYEKMINPR